MIHSSLGLYCIRRKTPTCCNFQVKKKLKGRFPQDVVVTTAPCANMIGDLMISTYIPQVIRARPNGFFKNKGVIFVDRHCSHVRDDVIKALNSESLAVLKIPDGTTCVLQPPDANPLKIV